MNHQSVQQYYGETLQSGADLQTNACCTPAAMPDHIKAILSKLHDEVLSKYYGCGLIAPSELKNMRILDLGCGAGRDVYVLSAMVGQAGSVVGVDMTQAQLDVAIRHQNFHARSFGHAMPNTEFHLGLIENLENLPLEPASFDVIVSNCVLNLATDKAAVLRGAHRLLKPGGEMYFSDVYADRRIPEALQKDEVLYGECLSGALYWNDFGNIAKAAGFCDPRLVEDRALAVENPALQAKLGCIGFTSATHRLFKIDSLEPSREDYGQAVMYRGTMDGNLNGFRLDKHNYFEKDKCDAVCGNTWRILAESRFSRHFEFIGNWDTHCGPFADLRGKTLDDGSNQMHRKDLANGCC